MRAPWVLKIKQNIIALLIYGAYRNKCRTKCIKKIRKGVD